MRIPAKSGSSGNTYSSYIQKHVTASTTFIVGFRIKADPNTIANTPFNNDECVLQFNDSGNVQVQVFVTCTGHFYFALNGVMFGTVSVRAISFSAYHYVEVKVKFDNASGTAELRVDGAIWLNLTGQDTKNTSTTSDAISLGSINEKGVPPNQHSLQLDFDDIYFCDDTGSFNKDFIGDVNVKMVLPNGNGTLNNYTRGGVDSGANWSQVEENPPNEDTDYVTDATVGNIDRYVYPAITGTLVKAVVVWNRARKDDGAARSIRAACLSGGTTGDSGADIPLSTNYEYTFGLFEVDPNTGVAWLVAAVNAAQFGIKTVV